MAPSRNPRSKPAQQFAKVPAGRTWSPGAALFLGASVAGMLGSVVVYLLQPEPLAATEADPSPPAAIAVLFDETPAAASPTAAAPAAASQLARSGRLPAATTTADVAAPAAPGSAPAAPAAPAAPLLTLAQLLELKALLARQGADAASGMGSDGGGDGMPGASSAAAEQLLFNNARQRFVQLQAQDPAAVDPAERRALADLVDDALEMRLQRRDIAPAEARALKALVLQVQEADADVRAARLSRWADAHAPAAEPPATAVARAASSAGSAAAQASQQ